MGLMLYILCVASFKLIEEEFACLTPTGVAVAIVLGALALIAAFSAPLWFPGLSRRWEKHDWLRWMSSPQFGRVLPFAAALFLLPVAGIFSVSGATVWAFILFGWSCAAILIYCGYLVDKCAR